MKMYIAVLDQVPDFIVPTLVAHSVLGCHNENSTSENYSEYTKHLASPYEELYDTWYYHSFKKCVVKVNQKEFDKIANLECTYLGFENTTLEGKHSCAVLVVDEDIPNVLKFAKLWKPSCSNTTEVEKT